MDQYNERYFPNRFFLQRNNFRNSYLLIIIREREREKERKKKRDKDTDIWLRRVVLGKVACPTIYIFSLFISIDFILSLNAFDIMTYIEREKKVLSSQKQRCYFLHIILNGKINRKQHVCDK